MSNATDTAAEEALLLELAQLGMAMARKVHEAALAADDTDRLIDLATAFHRMSRGVRQSLALRARFAAGTVIVDRKTPAEAAAPPRPAAERSERPDGSDYERPDWHERLASEPLETLHADDDVNRARIRRDLTIVSRTPSLAAIPALQAPAATLAGRAALLGGASLRLVNTS
jgi:hypothetical protein